MACLWALASDNATSTTYVNFGGVGATHHVSLTVVHRDAFNDMVCDIANEDEPFAIARAITNDDHPPLDWFHHDADKFIRAIVFGSGAALHIRSRYSTGTRQFHYFIADFDFDPVISKAARQLDRKEKLLGPANVARLVTREALTDRYGSSSHGASFVAAVKVAEKMEREGVAIDFPFRPPPVAHLKAP